MIIKIILIISFTLLGAFGAFFLKKATMKAASISNLIFEPNLYIGGILYFIAALLNIYALTILPYTIVLPLTSITYIWTLVISYMLLNENVNRYKIIGVTLIIGGSVFLGVSMVR